MAMSFSSLIECVDKINSLGDEFWLSGLCSRKIKELEFHDRDRDPEFIKKTLSDSDTFDKFYGNKKYYQATKRSSEYVQSWIKSNASPDSVFLDYACGNGANALNAAKCGVGLSLGLDISSVSIANARKSATDMGIDNVMFFQADAENTQLPDSSIDLIICSGMLHHLDLSFAFPELRRILKPGGRLLAVEALDYNPAIKMYRKLTPDMRTEWEKAHILDLRDVDFASRFFNVISIRYWHVTGYIGGKIPLLMSFFNGLDTFLERIPYVQRWSWIFTFELQKPFE